MPNKKIIIYFLIKSANKAKEVRKQKKNVESMEAYLSLPKVNATFHFVFFLKTAPPVTEL